MPEKNTNLPVFEPDSLAWSNANSLAGAFAVEVLLRLGLEQVVVSPGSRSTPFTFAFARERRIEKVVQIDERSAGFYALGLAKAVGKPVALVCTSGSAVANYYPAVVEARYGHVPLLVLSTDRPPELRGCHSGQTIEQNGIFASYPRFAAELPIPEEPVSDEFLRTYRDLLQKAFVAAQGDNAGPVHLNCPVRDPLAPTPGGSTVEVERDWEGLLPHEVAKTATLGRCPGGNASLDDDFWKYRRGLIIAGPAERLNRERAEAYVDGVSAVARATGWPVLADALSPLRHFPEASGVVRVSTYDSLLRGESFAGQVVPEAVVQLGNLPTSKVLRAWLESHRCPTLLVDPSEDNRDPLARPITHWKLAPEDLAETFQKGVHPGPAAGLQSYNELWRAADTVNEKRIGALLEKEENLFEGKLPWTLASALPIATPVFCASSMPVRDLEYFWPASSKQFRIFSNRGANGIDGTLSTALGVAHGSGRPAVLITGDLAFLHDSNGLLQAKEFPGSLTIFLVDNAGGGIFENLPIAAFEPPFEKFFATPQAVDWRLLAHAHGLSCQELTSWSAVAEAAGNLPERGVRVLIIKTNRKNDVSLRRQLLDPSFEPQVTDS